MPNMAQTSGTDDSSNEVRRPGSWASYMWGMKVQGSVIGALVLRELHTRYGRDNVGYLWIFGEPMMLAGAVSALHSAAHAPTSEIHMVPFALLGYSMFMMFRGMVTRAESALEANMPLLYHRNVSIFDMLFARAILEGLSTFATYLIIVSFLTAINVAELPARPFEFLIGVLLMFWFSFSVSMIITAVSHDNRVISRLVHPITYLLMPVSAAFFALSWIPDPYRTWLSYIPLTGINEQLRYGVFPSLNDDYANVPYVVGVCLACTYVGMVSIRMVRRHVHLR